jgi:hypothetical protein
MAKSGPMKKQTAIGGLTEASIKEPKSQKTSHVKEKGPQKTL